MTTTDSRDPAAQSKTFTRAFKDLADGLDRRQLWLHLGWQDIKQRYRRSVLGPIWITIATGTTAVAMGALYATLFRLELSEHLPYVTLGLIVWALISASDPRGSECSGQRRVDQDRPLHRRRCTSTGWLTTDDSVRHNLVTHGDRDHLPKPWTWADLSVIPALVLIMLNSCGRGMVFGISARAYRDISPLLGSSVQLLFFMTPIIWNARRWKSRVPGTGPRSSNSTRCCITSISCGPAPHRRSSGVAALGGGGGADGLG